MAVLYTLYKETVLQTYSPEESDSCHDSDWQHRNQQNHRISYLIRVTAAMIQTGSMWINRITEHPPEDSDSLPWFRLAACESTGSQNLLHEESDSFQDPDWQHVNQQDHRWQNIHLRRVTSAKIQIGSNCRSRESSIQNKYLTRVFPARVQSQSK
jgi:hypothetical protein